MSATEIFDGKSFGLGGVPFGNEFAYVTDELAYDTMAAALGYDFMLERDGDVIAAKKRP